MNCPDCDRVWRAYVDAVLQSARIADLHRIATLLNDTAKLTALSEAALSADKAWREARLALAEHLAANHPEESPG
jgi:hypothetical protein